MRIPFITARRERHALQTEFAAREKALSFLADMDAKAHQFIEQRSGQAINKLSDYESFVATGTGQVWATARAIHLVASTVSAAAFRVEDKKNGNIIEDKNLDVLIKQPNLYDSWEELIYLAVMHMKLTGNAYWLKDEMTSAGQPLYLYPLLPQNIKVVPDKVTRVKEYIYSVSGTEIKIPPEQMVHFRRPHPSSFVLGIGDVEGGAPLYDSYINRGALEDRFLANGAQPSGILTKKEFTGDEAMWEAYKLKFNNAYAGRANAGKVAFLNGDWSYLKLGLNPQEMQSIEKEQFTIEQIFLNHGIPLSVAGIRNSANFATAQVEDMAFRRYECLPLLRLITGKLNAMGGLAMAYSETEKVKFELTGLVNVEQIVKDYGPLVDRGAMTLNELREKAGLPKQPDPLLDMYYINNTRVPLELSGMATGDGGGEGDEGGGGGKPVEGDEGEEKEPPAPPKPPKKP